MHLLPHRESKRARLANGSFVVGGIIYKTREIIMSRGVYSDRPVYGLRPERNPAIRSQWEANKKIVLATQSICGICGKPVDKSLRYPDPMSPTVDHIIPVSKHGDPISLDNLQLAHRYCNRMKSDKLPESGKKQTSAPKGLPQSCNWRTD